TGVLCLGAQFANVLERVGVNADSIIAVQYLFAVLLVAILFEAIWRGPRNSWRWHESGLFMVVLLLLIFWATGLDFLFWIVLFAAGVPIAIAGFEGAVRHLNRPVERIEETLPDNLIITIVKRGFRSIILLVALWTLEQSVPSGLVAGND